MGGDLLLLKTFKQSPYLYRHSKSPSFYFRRRVPKRLQQVIGKNEIKLSLRSTSKSKATLMHDQVAVNNIVYDSPIGCS